MSKRDGWCIWSPWGGYLHATYERTRSDCIYAFKTKIDNNWIRYRKRGFECRPVQFVDARSAEAMQREGE